MKLLFNTNRNTRLSCFSQRWLVPLACLGYLAACAGFELNPPAQPPGEADQVQVVDAREIVALVPNAAAAEALQTGAHAEGFALREARPLVALNLQMLRFEIPQPLDGPGAIAALERIEPRATAGVNHAYTAMQTTASRSDRFDYASRLMGWPEGGCRAAGPLGMLDTGVDVAALEASGATIETRAFVRGAPSADRHGTDVAWVLVDPRRMRDVHLFSAAVVGQSARGREEAGVDAILAALDWMAGQGVRVVNISLSGPYNKILDRGIDRVTALGLTVVAPVGNDGASAAPRYPAAFDNVIGVTAVDATGAVFRDAVRGDHVDVAAPGVDILVPDPLRMRFATGTSMAVPFVTARIAADPGLMRATPPRIRAQLGAAARDLGSPGWDQTFGAGLLSAPAECS